MLIRRHFLIALPALLAGCVATPVRQGEPVASGHSHTETLHRLLITDRGSHFVLPGFAHHYVFPVPAPIRILLESPLRHRIRLQTSHLNVEARSGHAALVVAAVVSLPEGLGSSATDGLRLRRAETLGEHDHLSAATSIAGRRYVGALPLPAAPDRYRSLLSVTEKPLEESEVARVPPSPVSLSHGRLVLDGMPLEDWRLAGLETR